jgi:hypothetical protein
MKDKIFDFRLGQEVFVSIRGRDEYVRTIITCDELVDYAQETKYRIKIGHCIYDKEFNDKSFCETFKDKICELAIFDDISGKSRQVLDRFYAKFIALDAEESVGKDTEIAVNFGQIEIIRF